MREYRLKLHQLWLKGRCGRKGWPGNQGPSKELVGHAFKGVGSGSGSSEGPESQSCRRDRLGRQVSRVHMETGRRPICRSGGLSDSRLCRLLITPVGKIFARVGATQSWEKGMGTSPVIFGLGGLRRLRTHAVAAASQMPPNAITSVLSTP